MEMSHLIALAALILAIIRFIRDERRHYIKEKQDKAALRLRQLEEATKNGEYPPRKDTHRKR